MRKRIPWINNHRILFFKLSQIIPNRFPFVRSGPKTGLVLKAVNIPCQTLRLASHRASELKRTNVAKYPTITLYPDMLGLYALMHFNHETNHFCVSFFSPQKIKPVIAIIVRWLGGVALSENSMKIWSCSRSLSSRKSRDSMLADLSARKAQPAWWLRFLKTRSLLFVAWLLTLRQQG